MLKVMVSIDSRLLITYIMAVFEQTNIVFCLKSEFLQTYVHFLPCFEVAKKCLNHHINLFVFKVSMESPENSHLLPYTVIYSFGNSSLKELYFMDETFTYIFNGKNR